MALNTNSFRPRRYFRSLFREGKFLLAAEATNLQLESFEALRDYIEKTYGNIAVGPAFRPDQLSVTEIVVRPGEAWNEGLPFLMKSGTDPMVIEGTVPAGVSLSDLSATTSDIGGKSLDLSGGLADGSYSIVIEIIEERVQEAGTGAVDTFLEGINVGEGTKHQSRFTYKIHVVETSDLTNTPTYPLATASIDNHFVNEIDLTPTGTENFLVSAVDITQDPNGADRRIVLDNSAGNIPFSVDADDFIFGTLVDSDGNEFTITSISTSDGGATVQMLLDRQVDLNSNTPKSGLPVITTNVPYKLLKRDFYVTTDIGNPVGKSYFRVADFAFAGGALTSLDDLRIVSNVNTFGKDPNVRLIGGGIMTWSLLTDDLTFDDDLEVTLPNTVGKAVLPTPPGTISLPNNGDVAYVQLDRDASIDYNPTIVVAAKEDVPFNADLYVVAERQKDRVYFPHNGSIGDGDTGILGSFGSAFNKDLSQFLLVDSLTENRMDEIFAETFDTQDFVDQAESVSMTFEPFLKQFRSGSAARFIDYEANVLPSADPFDPWVNVGTQVEGVGGGLLTLTDASIGDRIAYNRVEASLVPTAHNDNKIRLRVTAASGTNPFVYEVRDGASGKHFGIAISTTALDLIDGTGASLATHALDGTTFHTYRLVKVGNKTVQVYVDDLVNPVIVYDYASIPTASGGTSDLQWGTTTTATATVDVDFVTASIYTSILQTIDVFRRGDVFYNGDVLPAADANPWTVEDGGGGITETISNGRLLQLVDNIGTNRIAYHRDEPTLIREGIGELEANIEISSGPTSFEQFGVRMEDGVKDIGAYLRDDGGTLKVGLREGASNTLRSLEADLAYDTNYVIKIRKNRNNTVDLLVDGVLVDTVSYAIFTDTTANNRLSFGSFSNTPQYTAFIDFVQYSLPGSQSLAKTPVAEFLAVVNGDDALPTTWVSTNEGGTWYEALDSIATVIEDASRQGANLIVRIGLSQINSVLTDFGILYNETDLEGVQSLEIDTLILNKLVSVVDPIPTANSYVEVSGSGTRTISDGNTDGQVLVITGEAGGGTAVTIQAAGANVQMPSDFTINEYDSIKFIWNGSFWVELSRSNN